MLERRGSVDAPTGSTIVHRLWTTCGSGRVGRQEMQVSDQEQVWTAVAHQLRTQLTEAVWYSTFQDVVPLEANGDHLSISVPSNHVRDRILTRYLPLVTEALDEVVAPGLRARHRRRRPGADAERGDRRRRAGRRDGRVRPRRAGLGCRARARRADAARRGRAQPALHVRDVRQGGVQPVRPRRRAAGRRDAGPLLQPAVHLRRRRPRQDPPAARHRALRPPQLPAPRGALRLDRDVPQRVRRRHPHQHRQRLQAALPRDRRAARSTTSSSSRTARACRRSSSTRSTRCTGRTSRSSSPATACPTPSRRSRSGCAAGSSGA